MNTVPAPDGTRIAWTSSGPPGAPTIVFVHSLGTNSELWRDQAEALADRYRLILVDLRGHGSSQAPPGPYSLPMLGMDLLAVVDAAEIDRFHLCGLSLGGQVALWMAIRHGDRLESVIACNTAAKVGSAERWAERIGAVRDEGMAAIAGEVLERWFSKGFAQRHPDRWAELVTIFGSTDPEGYVGCCAALSEADLRSEVDAIRAPTLVIGGEVDLSTPPAEAEWLHQHITGSRLEVFEGTGHLTNLENPDAFTQLVTGFIEATRRGDGSCRLGMAAGG